MKEKELNELLDKAIGIKGNLRIPAYWMRKVFSGLMEWCKTLTPKVDISKSDIPTYISQLENDAGYINTSDAKDLYWSRKTARAQMYVGSNNMSLKYPSTKGLNYGAINSNDDAREFYIESDEESQKYGYNDYKLLAFVKEYHSEMYGLDLPQGIYILNVSFFKGDISNTESRRSEVIGVSCSSRLKCSWVEVYSDDAIGVNINSISDFQFNLPTIYISVSVPQYGSNFIRNNGHIPFHGEYVSLGGSTASKIRIYGDAKKFDVSGSSKLKEIYVESNITKLSRNALSNCTLLEKVDFSKNTNVPTLDYSGSAAIISPNSSCKIIVPDVLYDEWIEASAWSNFKNQIIKASEYTE
jgi:hypothetical protein